jgi:3-oxo-5-alpha-steroid 4-dehydrogenase 1
MNYSGDSTFDWTLNCTLATTLYLLTLAKYMKRAPYGKFGGQEKLLNLNAKFGWWLMESPATFVFLYNYYRGRQRKLEKEKLDGNEKINGPSGWATKILFLIWCLHYGNRGWYFPLTIRVAPGSKQNFSLSNAGVGMAFLTAHAYMNGRLFSELGSRYTDSWLKDIRFRVGILIYIIGYITTLHSESVVRNLRPASGIASSTERYKIPIGGLFKYVTNPAYLGELTCWTGFIVLTWSPTLIPALLISLSNLVPRAFEQHKWYLKKFPNYPKDRKVLIPFLL